MNPAAPRPVAVLRRARRDDALPLAVLATQVWLHTYATDGVSAEIAAYVHAELTPERYRALIDDPQVLVEVVTSTADGPCGDSADGAPASANLLGLAVTRLDTPCPHHPEHRAELQTLYVQEHALRRGIGSRLLHSATAWAHQHTGAPPWLSVNARNTRAIAFYARHGQVRVGTLFFELGTRRHENHVMVGASIGPSVGPPLDPLKEHAHAVIVVRPLLPPDLGVYRALMLQAYASEPDAYTSTAEERAAEPDSWWLGRMAGGAAVGAWAGDELVGAVAMEYSTRTKTAHKAHLVGMFVAPPWRRSGAGRALVQAALAHAGARAGVALVTLTLTDGNVGALRLYESAGFVVFGVEPLAIRTGRGDLAKVHMARQMLEPPGAAGDACKSRDAAQPVRPS